MKVTNRSDSIAAYELDEMKVKRNFAPNETKDIPTKELETLYQQEGGYNLIKDFLMVHDKKWVEEHFPDVPIEYFWTVADIKNCLLTDPEDLFEETLDYAPQGVLDIMKNLSWQLPISDYTKMEAMRKKLGFDVRHAIEIMTQQDTASTTQQTHTTSRLRK